MTRIKSGFRLCEVGNEYIIVAHGLENINFSKVMNLNEIAAYLWEKIVDKEYFDETILTDLILQEYEIDEETARKDATSFINQLKEQELAE